MGRKKLDPGKGRTSSLYLRLTDGQKAWLLRYLAAHPTAETTTSLVWEAVVRDAKRNKFEPPPDA